jgi:hypothetical protein
MLAFGGRCDMPLRRKNAAGHRSRNVAPLAFGVIGFCMGALLAEGFTEEEIREVLDRLFREYPGAIKDPQKIAAAQKLMESSLPQGARFANPVMVNPPLTRRKM